MRYLTIVIALTICACSAGRDIPDEPPMEPPAHKDDKDNWVHADVGETCGEELNIRCVDAAYCQATPTGAVCVLDERAAEGEVCKSAAGAECKDGLVCTLDETSNDGSGICEPAD